MTNFPKNTPVTFDHHWMPFTANQDFAANPRLVERAEGMVYFTPEGDEILDMTAGLWCCNLGHGCKEIADAVRAQFDQLDFAPSFSFGHPLSFQLAERLAKLLPGDINTLFFANSGSEAVETAIKIAYAYHDARGQGGRKRIISRQRGYHGVNFAGVSLGGITANRKAFGQWLPVDHLSATHDLSLNAFSKGQPERGGEAMANELEALIRFHDPETIAAVIVEPIAGAGGVLLPPKGYLERLRELCSAHGILLIFDEVITGFGRTGKAFAAETFGVTPDIMTMAKGITSATVPMGAAACRDAIRDAVFETTAGMEFFHGYTYSAHPLACAASMACLDLYEKEDLFTRASGPVSDALQDMIASFKDLPRVIDTRGIGFIGAVEFEPLADKPGSIGGALLKACWQQGVMIRGLGDAIAISPPLIVEEAHINRFADGFRKAVHSVLG
ncbi:aminotransferase class III-fold pyridoxal phosphate-dependent enzyme [uncultured Cohaesibacter sp.]|uniref:aminotransferase class III-fold pyridoxal phosphate-dependent enzyme n=1 Tax=uncultured Cohaesibacter sp. TaxID=1002546 RepID=UPI0029C8FB48|nr:aminotransferase class III-fold pyridoxal phosphate-dependent enzyme [uncultured Cohaesibacter sp.]